MGVTTAKTTADVVDSLLGSPQGQEEMESQNSSILRSDNHVLHFNHLPPYMIQDILDLLKHCKINDWTIDNKDKDTILSFHPEIGSSVDVFYDNLTGYQIKYNRMAV